MTEKTQTGLPSEVVRAVEAEREAAERVAAARREAEEIVARARENARRIKAEAEAEVSRMSRHVSDEAVKYDAAVEKDLEQRLKALEAEEVSPDSYRAAAAAVAITLLGFGDGQHSEV